MCFDGGYSQDVCCSYLGVCVSRLEAPTGIPIVCSRSVGRGLRAEVYVMVECSYMPIEMYGESWIAGLLTSDDVMLYMAGFGTT